ncbi:MFS transporter, PPP family, 3-phenylpropionic acid transporter [Ferrimonas sediminum]|uniref:MFS transporter, PPP family, 3-phenylpropionic acid transporter n=1 Tax=Ferrimonas sediminum TaxID=718193 RepID=A0A1G8XV56_9GAMM|nr:MFS transporter [Ferrimonas sediminum]SDJ94377.1 MFS transporter, PPP family, 3-phenylpropionic acid transporter [Ferrimonas sediminum]
MTLNFWQPQRQLLAANYLFYFAMQGLTVPFMGIYLDLRGFSAPEIGTLMAAQMTTAMVSPYLWASLADYSGRRASVAKLGVTLALAGFAGLFIAQGFWETAAALMAFSFSWSGILAQLEVLTLSSLKPRTELYSKIRSWGSVGYLLMVIAAGWAFERWDAGLLPWLGVALLAAMIGFTLALRGAAEPPQRQSADWSGIHWSRVGLYLAFAFSLNASHGGYYGFYVLYLQTLGISESMAGVLLACGVMAEVGLFALMPRLLRRIALDRLMILCGALALLRWYLTAQMTTVAGQLPAQLLHAASFALAHACAMQFIHHEFKPGIQGRMQALYGSLAFSGGGALGIYLSGHLWQQHPERVWQLAMALSMLSLLMALLSRSLGYNKRIADGQDHDPQPCAEPAA